MHYTLARVIAGLALICFSIAQSQVRCVQEREPVTTANAEITQKNALILAQVRQLLAQLSPTPQATLCQKPEAIRKVQCCRTQGQAVKAQDASIFQGATTATSQASLSHPSNLVQNILKALSTPITGFTQSAVKSPELEDVSEVRALCNYGQAASPFSYPIPPSQAVQNPNKCTCSKNRPPYITKQLSIPQGQCTCRTGGAIQPSMGPCSPTVSSSKMAPIVVIPILPKEQPVSPKVSCCGPPPKPTAILPLPVVHLRTVDAPIIHLPAPPLPPPTVIANKCSCTKVVVKPQLYQRIVSEKKNLRFLKKSARLVSEQVAYTAKPRC